MLHFNSSKRLSIDIDIVLSEIPEKLNELLDSAAFSQGFQRKEFQQRKSFTRIKKHTTNFIIIPYTKRG